MPAPIKKSSDGEIYVQGPVETRKSEDKFGRPLYRSDSSSSQTGVGFDMQEQADALIERDTHLIGDKNVKLLIVTDKEQKKISRLFTGTLRGESDKIILTINKTLNPDAKANPRLASEVLDAPIEIELTPEGTIRQADVDKLQALIKSGKLVKAEPAKNAELDALLAQGPKGTAQYEGGAPLANLAAAKAGGDKNRATT